MHCTSVLRRTIPENAGITLIALIITIIILLILAGVAINFIIGENGILRHAQNATVETQIKEIEEKARMIYADKKMDEITTKEKATLENTIKELQKQGYSIKQLGNQESGIEDITIENKEIKMDRTTTKGLGYTIIYKDKTVKYYAKIQNRYYEIAMSNGEISVRTEATNLGNVDESNLLKVESSNTNIVNVELLEESIELKSGNTLGEATITISKKDGSINKECKVTVTTQITDLIISPTDIGVSKGNTKKITVEIRPSSIGHKVEWATSDENIATVSEDGTITGINEGRAVITATSEGISKECMVVVALAGKAATIESDIYGKTVTNYTQGGQTWEVFYADYDNIYLITHDVVTDPQYNSKSFSKVIENGTYSEGSGLLNNETRFPAAKRWLYEYMSRGYSNENVKTEGMQGTMFMLDSTGVWNKKYKNSNADYAIGGPTSELLEHAERKSKIQCSSFTVQIKSKLGYKCPRQYWTGYESKDCYLYHGEEYWIATPYGRDNEVNCNSLYYWDWNHFSDTWYKAELGFRPVVRLNTSIKLVTSDGGSTYRISY